MRPANIIVNPQQNTKPKVGGLARPSGMMANDY